VALLDNAGITSPKKSEMFQRIDRGEANPLLVTNATDFSNMLSFVFVTQPLIPETLKQHFAEQAIANQPLNEKIFAQLLQRYIPLEPELGKIQAPTLVLWGDKDRILDISSIEVMQPLLKHPTVVIMKDCGHAPMIERPDETAAHYQAFLNSHQG
jgi:abhydrolase domain-containing protein 6